MCLSKKIYLQYLDQKHTHIHIQSGNKLVYTVGYRKMIFSTINNRFLIIFASNYFYQ